MLQNLKHKKCGKKLQYLSFDMRDVFFTLCYFA